MTPETPPDSDTATTGDSSVEVDVESVCVSVCVARVRVRGATSAPPRADQLFCVLDLVLDTF